MGKWKPYVPILLIFLCLTGGLAYGLGQLDRGILTPANLSFRDEAHDLTLVPYYGEAEDAYFLFLPACTAPSDLTITNPITVSTLPFSLIDVYQGADLSAPCPALEFEVGGKTFRVALWQCGNLPSLFLQGKPDMLSKVHSDKRNKITSQVKILDENGTPLLQEVGTLSGRGNGTWSDLGRGQAKRPYNLHFSTPITFGPFQDLSDLCLLAEYSDESKLRNSLAYFAGQALGIDYASPYAYVNVYANGEYLGLYGVATKKEYTKYAAADGLQSVFEITANFDSPSFFSDSFHLPMEVMYGETAHTQALVGRFESALAARDWEQCRQLLSLEDFARMYALEEFLCNVDMTYASQYFYIDGNDVLHTMLPWDFDYSLGSAITHFDPFQERTLMACRNSSGSSWYPALLQWDGFRQQVADTIAQSFTDDFFRQLSAHLREDISQIEASRRCDLRRWQAEVPFTDSPIASGMETLPEFYDFFTNYFPKRRDFLLDYFQNYDAYCRVTLQSWDGNWYNTICIPKGSRPADFIDEPAFLQRISPEGFSGLFLATPDRVPLREIEAVTEDLTLIVTWE